MHFELHDEADAHNAISLILELIYASIDCIKRYLDHASLARTKALVNKYQERIIERLLYIHKHEHKPIVRDSQIKELFPLYDDNIGK